MSDMEIRKFSQNENDTYEIAELVAKLAQPGDVYVLEGELGAGKTTFTKGFAKALGVERLIKSPTYTLIREYTEGRMPLYHMDLYRLEEDGADALGLEEYFNGEGVCIVEWGSLVPDQLPKEYLLIELSRTETESEDEREYRFVALGERYETMIDDLGHQILNKQS